MRKAISARSSSVNGMKVDGRVLFGWDDEATDMVIIG
jgi:hypothetical protein